MESHRKLVEYCAEKRVGNAVYILWQQECFKWGDNELTTANLLIRDYLSYRINNPDKTALALAVTNSQVQYLNKQIREVLKKIGFLTGEEIHLTVTDTDKKWKESFARGDEIVVRSNYKSTPVFEIPEVESYDVEKYSKMAISEEELANLGLIEYEDGYDSFDVSKYKLKDKGVFNRMSGKIKHIQYVEDGSYDIFIDTTGEIKSRVVINTKKHLNNNALPIHHNYATTIYSSQGQTVDKVFLQYGQGMHWRFTYVGFSRHREDIAIYLNKTLLHHQCNVARRISSWTDYKDMNGNERPLVLDKYTTLEMLNCFSAYCAAEAENPTVTDYLYEKTLNSKSEFSKKELSEVRPANIDEMTKCVDFDLHFKHVKMSDICYYDDNLDSFITDGDGNPLVDPLMVEQWWRNLYVEEKGGKSFGEIKKYTPEELTIILQDEANSNSESFIKFKEKILKINNLPLDYQLETRDRIYTKPLTSKRIPVLDVAKILEESPDNYTFSKMKPDNEIALEQFKEGSSIFAEEIKPKESPVIDVSDLLVFNEPEQKKAKSFGSIVPTDQSLIQALGFDLRENPEPLPGKRVAQEKTIFFLDDVEPTITTNIKGDLVFIDPERKLSPELNSFINNPQVKQHYWETGRYHEVRFLARDENFIVRERYDEFGNAILGTGYPMILANPQANEDTPVVITPPNFEAWFLTYTVSMRKKMSERKPEEAPEVIFGSPDTDYGKLIGLLQGRNFLIMKGRSEAYDDWAVSLQEKLWNTWKVKAIIKPELSRPREVPWANATEEELQISKGVDQTEVIRRLAEISRKSRKNQ